MISSILIENIYNFVNRLGVVNETQVMKMFEGNHGKDVVQYNINYLVKACKINRLSNTDVLTRRESVFPNDLRQKLLTKAAWFLSNMGEQNVREYFTLSYPAQLLIIGENEVCYDITVFTHQTLNTLKMTVVTDRLKRIPEGVKDEIIHIALLPDKEMAGEIKELNFDSYCILDKENNTNYFN